VQAIPAIRGDRRLRSALVMAGARLEERGLVVHSVGNLSARSAEGIVITPTRVPYAALSADDLVTVDLAGSVIDGDRVPSRELGMHLAIYLARPDVGAIVHTHSVHATAWSFLGEPLLPRIEDLDYYGVGEVRTALRAEPGSPRLAAAASAALGDSAAVLLAGHGAVAVGTTVEGAVTVAEVVERQAQVAWLVRSPAAAAAGRSGAGQNTGKWSACGQNTGTRIQTVVQPRGSVPATRGVGRW
jgi:L-fuculose-phosphate aldolase